MSAPETEAGRRLLNDYLGGDDGHTLFIADIAAIEAEAIATERARIERAIAGISLPPGPDFSWVDGHRPFIQAALAIVRDEHQ